MPEPCFCRCTLELLIVDWSIGSLNWTWTLVLRGTSVAFGDGVRPVIVGAVLS